MKKLMGIFIFSFVSLACYAATIRSVSNVDSSAQFSTIQAAIDASSSGDSIYVCKSTVAYDNFTITDKKLAIFGPGWSPFVPGLVQVPGCTLTGTRASGSELHGLYFTSSISINTAGINNLLIYRNRINSISFNSANNYVIQGNWFDQASIFSYSPVSNFSIRNNIFYNSSFNSLSGSGIVFDHNLWYASSSSQCFYNCFNLTISNNIFDREDASGTSLSTFNNNITHNTSNDAPWNSNNNTNSGGNIAGKDPQTTDQESVNNGTNNPLLNFTIATGYANNTGSDGKDMGLLFDKGGVVNWKRCRASHLPFVSQFIIKDQTIFSNSYIRFSAQAKGN